METAMILLPEKYLPSILQRQTYIFLFFSFLFFILICRLLYLQVYCQEYYEKQAFQQHWKKQTLEAPRGSILDRHGVVLAMSVPSFSCHANPRLIQNPDKTATILSKIFSLSKETILSSITHPKRRFVWIKRKISSKEKELVEKEKISGIGFVEEQKRVYPHQHLASHILGFADIDQKGLEGIELTFQSELAGQDGFQWTLKDGRTRQHRILLPDAPTQKMVLGIDVYLTLDIRMQAIVEKELDDVMEKYKALGAACVLLDVNTAEVLALSSRPTFNPNVYQKSPRENWRNKAISDAFELGSVMKPLIVAAGLAEKKVSPQTIIDCGPGWCRIIPGRTLRDSHPCGKISVEEVLIQSSNIGSAKIGIILGKQKLYAYLSSLGFGKKTNIELQGESIGILKTPEKWSDFTLTSVPMGHEITATPLQMTAAYLTLAGDGIYRKPSIIHKIQYKDGTCLYKEPPSEYLQIFPPSLLPKMREILHAVVQKGTARRANIKELSIAGKTGTAQKIVNGQYSHSKHIAVFVGFAPADNPAYCALVMVDEPQGASYGGTVSAPVVTNILKHCCYYAKQ